MQLGIMGGDNFIKYVEILIRINITLIINNNSLVYLMYLAFFILYLILDEHFIFFLLSRYSGSYTQGYEAFGISEICLEF